MEITPESPIVPHGILSILFSFFLFALSRHYSFLFPPALFHSTSFTERLIFFIFFSRLFCLILEYCSSIIAIFYTFRHVRFSNLPLTIYISY